MKYLIILFILLLIGTVLQGQAFKNLRYDESYVYLKDSTHKSLYNSIKFRQLGNSAAYITVGGEVRYNYFRFENEDWGDAPRDDDGFILHRLLLHADLHLNDRFRVFVQLQSNLADGRVSTPSPVDQNELDLHQAFFDYLLLNNNGTSLTFRGGRQEMAYGLSRLVSTREGPNNRQAFDGAKLILNKKDWRTDFFFTEYVSSKRGIFNDEFFNANQQFWGAYSVKNNVPIIKNIDFYYLGIKKLQTTWNDIHGSETRHSFGARIWGTHKRFNYDFEGVYQFGNMEGNSISAWTLSSSSSYALNDHDLSPFIGLKTELISGDEKANDGKIQSFDPLFPRGAYFGYAALIGPSNLFDIHPSLSIPLTRKITTTIDYDIFWRFSTSDGIYSPGATVIFPAGASDQKFIGNQVSGNIEFQYTKFLYIRAEITWFESGKYLKSVSEGKDILFTGLTTTLKF